jgi:protein-L-isoaspartate(D-aspartate) O-methyltransferase
MTLTAEATRHALAEEIRVVCNIQSPRLIEAIAATPRHRFLGPGPWLIRGPHDKTGVPGPGVSSVSARFTDDADPRHVHHDVVVALDPSRDLYNGQPSLIATWLEALAITEGDRVLHIGCATGYFTALIGHIVGRAGHVTAMEIDPGFVERARVNLADMPWIDVRQGNGTTGLPSDLDVVLVHAGASHLLDGWLDAVHDGGRVLASLTCTLPGMPPTLGKGFAFLATRHGEAWRATALNMVAIYTLKDARDEATGAALGNAMMAGTWAKVTRLRRDTHELSSTCWLHTATSCLSTD